MFLGRPHNGANDNLLGVMSEDIVGQGITLVLGNSNPAAKGLQTCQVVQRRLLASVEEEIDRHISDLASHKGERDQAFWFLLTCIFIDNNLLDMVV